ncbi:MAG: hypothetical protein DDT36_01158 [Firmicutes bacterium]|nr:hypothetical protein [Bacillota bacterium]
MGGGGAKATGVAAGGVDKADDFADGLGKIAAAALVHIAAGFFGAFDDVVDV